MVSSSFPLVAYVRLSFCWSARIARRHLSASESSRPLAGAAHPTDTDWATRPRPASLVGARSWRGSTSPFELRPTTAQLRSSGGSERREESDSPPAPASSSKRAARSTGYRRGEPAVPAVRAACGRVIIPCRRPRSPPLVSVWASRPSLKCRFPTVAAECRCPWPACFATTHTHQPPVGARRRSHTRRMAVRLPRPPLRR